MLKRCGAFFLMIALLLGCVCPAQAMGLSNAERYEAALQELHWYLDGNDSIPLTEIVKQFDHLGRYKKSSAFSYYAAVLNITETEDFRLLSVYTSVMRLDDDFCALLEAECLPSVEELENYALGQKAEAEGNPTVAIEHYEQSVSVLDSMDRLTQLMINSMGSKITAKPVAKKTPTPPPAPTTVPTPTPTTTPKPKPRTVETPGVRIGDYVITTYSDKTCTITTFYGPVRTRYTSMIDVDIPSTLNGYKVTAIGNSAFAKEKMIRSVTIPEGVTSIGEKAFFSCTAVKKITIPSTVTVIGRHAFDYCKSLTTISLPDGLTRLEDGTFSLCSNLTTITIPESVTYIGNSVFPSSNKSLIVYVSEGSTAHEILKNTNNRSYTLSVY